MSTEDINTAHHQLFCARRGSLSLARCHHARTAFSCMPTMTRAHMSFSCMPTMTIWRGSLQQHPHVPSPVEHGWAKNDDGQLIVEWMRGSPAPDAVLQLLSCKCSRGCKLSECQCMSNGLKCTNMCKLQTCANQPQDEDIDMMISEA